MPPSANPPANATANPSVQPIIADHVIDESRFDQTDGLKDRVASIAESDREALDETLRFLYLSDGPTQLPKTRLRVADAHLEPTEKSLVRWLHVRSNGRLRDNFGDVAIRAARAAHYKCQFCGFADVRALHLENAHGRRSETQEFICLCSNCHAIKHATA